MATWTVKVDCYEKIPEFFKEDFAKTFNNKMPFPYILYTPGYQSVKIVNKPNLLVWDENQIYIFEKNDNDIKKVCYQLADINYLEHGCILLNSWITFTGNKNKETLTTTVYFNTSLDNLFFPIIKAIRLAGKDVNISKSSVTKNVSSLDYLKDKNEKFMNYSVNNLMPGQEVISSVYESDIIIESSKSFTIFDTTITTPKMFKMTLSTSHIVILTNDELIVVEEKPTPEIHDINKYGCIIRYIPVDKIARMNVGYYTEGEFLNYTLVLKDYNMINLLFTYWNKEKLEALIAAFVAI